MEGILHLTPGMVPVHLLIPPCRAHVQTVKNEATSPLVSGGSGAPVSRRPRRNVSFAASLSRQTIVCCLAFEPSTHTVTLKNVLYCQPTSYRVFQEMLAKSLMRKVCIAQKKGGYHIGLCQKTELEKLKMFGITGFFITLSTYLLN